jgi:anhydro-N-acetylmuramic acid kinase
MLTVVKRILTLGIMSGTSLDGVDYALCALREGQLRLVEFWTVPFPRALHRRLEGAARGAAGSSWALAQLHHDLGRFYARGARQLPGRAPLECVGLHGQTIFHQPAPGNPATLQIGEPAYLAAACRAPVVSNFRAADLAMGGQGAPLATAFHVRAFALRGQVVCVNNLGGISNVTCIDWSRGSKPRVMAFDTGPANVLIDLAAREATGGRSFFDRDGRGAARGKVCAPLLEEWLRHPFFRAAPPKSTGREMFGEPFWLRAHAAARRRRLSPFDLLATLTELTAQSIASNYQRHLPAPPDVVVLCGGGARNPVLRSALTRALGLAGMEASVMTTETLGWPVASVEPAAFAWLAWLRCQGLPGNLPETTGARRPVLCGQITEV